MKTFRATVAFRLGLSLGEGSADHDAYTRLGRPSPAAGGPQCHRTGASIAAWLNDESGAVPVEVCKAVGGTGPGGQTERRAVRLRVSFCFPRANTADGAVPWACGRESCHSCYPMSVIVRRTTGASRALLSAACDASGTAAVDKPFHPRSGGERPLAQLGQAKFERESLINTSFIGAHQSHGGPGAR